MSEQRHQDSQYKSARTSPNSTALEFSEAVPLGADILLDWDRSGSEGLSDLAQVLKGQQSEYGGHLFDQLVDSDEDRSRFNPALERYTQIIPGERFEPDEQHFKVFIAAANHRSFEPRSSIIFGGERCDSVFLLLRGMVSVHIDGAAGREVIVDYLSAGEFFGELPMFLDSWQRSAGVKAKCHCELAELSYARFRALSQQYPDLLFAFAKQMANRLVRTTQKVSDLAFLDVTGRFARTLMELSKQPDAVTHPQGMQIKVTRQELGNIVGCSREMAGRAIRGLSSQGLITVRGKTMVVHGTR